MSGPDSSGLPGSWEGLRAVGDEGARELRRDALVMIEQQPRDLVPGSPEILQRVCRAVTMKMDLAGATVTLVPDLASHAVAAASGQVILRTEELQFDAGEGPTREAHEVGRPVLAADLERCLSRWPGYAPAALAAGVCAAFSFPLHVGAAKLGAMSLYWSRPRRPATGDLRVAAAYVEIATEILVDDAYAEARGRLDPSLDSTMDVHEDVYQAQGMVMVDLGVPLPEALARMRARAFSDGLDLGQLSRDIVDGTTTLTKDGP